MAAIVLAAGGSSRMGRTKQLLPVAGRPMVRLVTETVCASRLGQVVVVVGADAEAVKAALEGLPVDLILNPAWTKGMSTSVRAGIRALKPGIRGALMVLADQPGLTPSVIASLVDRYRATQAAIVAPFYEGQRGNPVLFDRVLFPELLAVVGDEGGRTVINKHWGQMECVCIDHPSVTLDIDTPQDYANASRYPAPPRA